MSKRKPDTPITRGIIAEFTSQIVGAWSDDPLLLYKDIDQSKELLQDILKESFKQSNSRQSVDLVFDQFSLR